MISIARITLDALSRIMRGSLCATFLLTAGYAIAQTTITERLKPRLVAQLTVGSADTNGYYDSVVDAFAAYKAWAEAPPWSSPSHQITVNNVRPCTSQWGYMWGYPVQWCAEGVIYNNGQVDQSYSDDLIISMTETCPVGYGMVWDTFSGGGGVPYIVERHCERQKTQVCRECGLGNLIYPASGTKRQEEIDYRSALGDLTLVRTYDSDRGTFRVNPDVTLLLPMKGATAGCTIAASQYYEDGGTHLSDPYCFPSINLSSSTARILGQTGIIEELNWSGSVGLPAAPQIVYQLSSTTFDGQLGYALKSPRDGKYYLFSAGGSLRYAIGQTGGQVKFDYSSSSTPLNRAPDAGYLISMTGSFGRSLQLSYDGKGRLVSVLDPAGQVIGYSVGTSPNQMVPLSSASKPLSVQYPDGSARTYVWDEVGLSTGTVPGVNRLTGIVDELGVRFASFGYQNGRAVSTEHAGSTDRFALSDQRSGGSGPVSITYPSGQTYVSTYSVVGEFSRLTTHSQPAGSGCLPSASALAYDANGNVAVKDDFNGTRSCYANDLSRNLETTRVEGLSQTTDCSTVTSNNAVLPANSRKVSTNWHPDWRLSTRTAEPGRITTSVYNGQADPFNGNAIASCAPSTALLPDGKPIAVLCKQVEQATTDSNGAQGFSAALQSGVASRTQSWTYNQWGQVLTAKGPRTDVNDTTSYAYYADTTTDHTLGDLQSVTNAAGKVTSYTQYNKHGQVLQSQDPNGVVTVNTYDLRQRLLSSTIAGQTTSYSYDAVGQLKKVTLPDQSWMGYDYDDAHRQVAVYDNQGNRSEYVLDNAGNKTAENIKDPSGNLKRQLSRSIDALGRVQQTTGE
ncbi:MAG: RHS repeat protein [Rhizobacter sp.]